MFKPPQFRTATTFIDTGNTKNKYIRDNFNAAIIYFGKIHFSAFSFFCYLLLLLCFMFPRTLFFMFLRTLFFMFPRTKSVLFTNIILLLKEIFLAFVSSDNFKALQNLFLLPLFHTVGNHVTVYTYIRTERVSIFVIISLMLNEFSYGKAQIPHRFCI